MKRPVTIAIFVCIFAFGVASKPNKTSDLPDQYSQPQPSQPTVTSTSNEATRAHHQEADCNPPHWYTAIKRPEWWLVALGFPTLAFLAWQAWETRRAANASKKAAEAAQRSADVAWRSLKVMYRVHLRIDDWKIFIGSKGTDDAEIRFKIFNPSITSAKIEGINCIDMSGNKEDICPERPVTLSPQESYWVSIYPSDILWFERNDNQAAAIRIEIIYSDGFAVGRRRRFAKDCICRGRGTSRDEFIFVNPEDSGCNYEKEDDYWYSQDPKNPD